MNETLLEDESIREEPDDEQLADHSDVVEAVIVRSASASVLNGAPAHASPVKSVKDNDEDEVINVVDDDDDVVSSPITEDGVDELPIDDTDELKNETNLCNETVPNNFNNDIERTNGHQVVSFLWGQYFFVCMCM